MDIEVEIRSLITKEQYNQFLEMFRREGKFQSEDYQETYYFDSKEDLRIQKNNFFSKIWLKKGRLHDEHREEIEIRFPKEDFNKLEHLFISLGFSVQIKWFRTRHTFSWQGISVMVDHTKGYGHIIELEKMSDENDKETALAQLKQKMQLLGISQTPKEEFDKKYQHYKENWKEVVDKG